MTTPRKQGRPATPIPMTRASVYIPVEIKDELIDQLYKSRDKWMRKNIKRFRY